MASASGVPADRQRLIFRGRVLPSDAEKLRDVAGFRDGDALHVVASSSAPPPGDLAREDIHAARMETSRNDDDRSSSEAAAFGSVSLPARAPGSPDALPGVLDALVAATARDLAAATSVLASPASVSFAATSNTTPVAASNATQVAAYADPTAAAARHAAFVRETARELAADPHGVSRGDGERLSATLDGDRLGSEARARDDDAAGVRSDDPTSDGTSNATTRCTHFGVQCDACGVVPIVGVRYKSASRADYDLCETCHGAGRARGVAPPEGPFAALRSPLPGLVPPPTAAPAGLVAADAASRRRAPPVVTAGALASALAEAARAARETAPALEAAAASLAETESGSVLSADRLHEIQGQTLRASMAAHGAGSLLMELARLAASVQVAGGAAAAPEFLNRLARAPEGPGGARADPGTAPPAAAERRRLAFLAPPLVYLDPRGGTQPLSGMGARPNQLLSGTYGGAPVGAAGARGAGSTPPFPGARASAEARSADIRAVEERWSSSVERMRRDISAGLREIRGGIHRMEQITRDTSVIRRRAEESARSARAPRRRGPMSALRGGFSALGGAARFALSPLFFFRRRAGSRDRTRDPTEDFPERAAGGPARADVPSRRGAASSPAAGSPSAATPAAPPRREDAAAPAPAQPQRSTFNFRFESNVRVARRPQGDAAAQAQPPQQAAAAQPQQAAAAQPQQAAAAQPQQAQASSEASRAQAQARAAAAAQAAAAASFQQGIGALLNHLQQGGNVAPGARMRLVPTAEGGFTLEPAGAAELASEASGGGTSGGTAPAAPTTPASAPAPANSDAAPAPPQARSSGAGIGSSPAEVSVSASAPPRADSAAVSVRETGEPPRGVGSGLPPREASRAPKPRTSSEAGLPRQDSLD